VNPQDGPEDGGIGHAPVLALRRGNDGGWVIGVEPDTTVRGRLVMVLLPALHSATQWPVSTSGHGILTLGSALMIGQLSACVNGRVGPLFLRSNMLAFLSFRGVNTAQ
jgi:hypothetical protein